MHTMRHIISLVEATKTTARLSPEEEARQRLVTAKSSVETLLTKARSMAKQAPLAEHTFSSWNRNWVEEVTGTIKGIYKRDLANAKEEHADDLEDNPNAKLRAVDFYECISDGISQWWDRKSEDLDWRDAEYRLDRYMDAHNLTEQSDDMSRLDGEKDLLTRVKYHGGFGAAGEMAASLTAMDMFFDVLSRHSDGGWSEIGETAMAIVNSGIPVILFYCNSVLKVG
jgi:hypothetical protein